MLRIYDLRSCFSLFLGFLHLVISPSLRFSSACPRRMVVILTPFLLSSWLLCFASFGCKLNSDELMRYHHRISIVLHGHFSSSRGRRMRVFLTGLDTQFFFARILLLLLLLMLVRLFIRSLKVHIIPYHNIPPIRGHCILLLMAIHCDWTLPRTYLYLFFFFFPFV